METCHYCGQEIEFRYMDGRCVPIHPGGGWHCGYTASAPLHAADGAPTITRRDWRERDFTKHTRCPKCGEEVFFIRHNGGSVWVDPPLGWPWAKHPCFDDPEQSSFRLSSWTSKSSGLTKPMLGVVVAVKNNPRYAEPQIEIRLSDSSRVALVLRWTPPDKLILGALVTVSREDNLLIHQQCAEIPFHSLCDVKPPRPFPKPALKKLPALAGQLDAPLRNAIDLIASQAWQEVAGLKPEERQFKQAKQAALSLIRMLPGSMRGQVEHHFTAQKWEALLIRRPHQ